MDKNVTFFAPGNSASVLWVLKKEPGYEVDMLSKLISNVLYTTVSSRGDEKHFAFGVYLTHWAPTLEMSYSIYGIYILTWNLTKERE
jgi:hypothetical protein